ncbi:MAG: tetratricopeptide repeat protein [Pseudomonadota bacterium]
MRKFLEQLRRRNVFQALATYLVAGWLILQVMDVVGPSIGLGDRAMSMVILILAVGLPVVAVVSWFYEVTASGIVRDSGEHPAPSPSSSTMTVIVISLLVAALTVSLITRQGSQDHSGTTSTDVPIVAVLPLEHIGSEPDDGFVEGLHADLLSTLSRVKSMRVISRSSMQRYRKDRPTLSEISRRLGAGVIIEGTVQRSDNTVRIQVNLIDPVRESSLWSNLFERPISATNLFAIQSEIARAIASQLQLVLTGEEETGLAREPTENFDAYSAYLLGRQRIGQRTSASVREAEAFFRESIRHDPKNAEGWAGLAEAIYQQHGYASLDRATMLKTAMPPVQHALKLNPRLSDAHAVLGVLRMESQDEQGAESSLRRAIELNPSNARPHLWLGSLKYAQGQSDRAAVWHQRALELDPLSPTFSNALAQDLLSLGQLDRAMAQYERSLDIDPEFVATYAHLSELERTGHGRPDKALELLVEAHRKDPEHSEYAALAAQALIELDDPEHAAAWVERAMETAPDQFWAARVNLLLALRRDDGAAIDAALDHYESHLGSAWLSLVARRDRLLAAGDVEQALNLFLQNRPDLFGDPPALTAGNFYLGPALAVIYEQLGEAERAADVLGAASDALASVRADGNASFDFSEVEILALSGEERAAVETLSDGLTNDYLSLWWYFGLNQNLKPLQRRDDFEQVLSRIRSRMHALRDAIPAERRRPPALASTG